MTEADARAGAAEFTARLRQLHAASGLSQRAAAAAAGMDQARYNRLLHGEPPSSREQALALARALGADAPTADRLLAAAGYLPPSVARLGLDDPVLGRVLRLLGDEVPPARREQVRMALATILAWAEAALLGERGRGA